jgi:hypothetical protein
LKGSYALDKFGQYNGAAEEYFENGFVREGGYYKVVCEQAFGK